MIFPLSQQPSGNLQGAVEPGGFPHWAPVLTDDVLHYLEQDDSLEL